MRKKNLELYKKILEEISTNSFVTERVLAIKYGISERTIRRYFKELKDLKMIKMVRKNNVRKWYIYKVLLF